MMPGIMTQEFSVPPMADKLKNKNEMSGYSIKYFKADMDELTEMSELESIVTSSVDGSGDVVLLKEEAYTFMTQRFICIQYARRNPE